MASKSSVSEELKMLAKEIELQILRMYGESPILGGEDVRKVLGYGSMGGMRTAIQRNTFQVPLFKMKNRAGYFVLVKDVAEYLAQQRLTGLVTD